MKETSITKSVYWRGLPVLLIFAGFLFSSWKPVYGQVSASHDPTGPNCKAEATNPVFCKDGADGVITITWTGGAGPFNVYLNNVLKETSLASPYVITGLSAGNYATKVVDIFDREAICQVVIPEPEYELEADWEGQKPTAGIAITVSGGTPPYNLSGVDEVIPPSNDGIFSLSHGSGSSILLITDNNGCVVPLNIPLIEASLLTGPTATTGSSELNGIGAEVFPNPFRNHAQIFFSVKRDTRAIVEVFTLQGSKLDTLFDAHVTAEDIYSVTLSSETPSGNQVFIVVIRTDYGRITRQILSY